MANSELNLEFEDPFEDIANVFGSVPEQIAQLIDDVDKGSERIRKDLEHRVEEAGQIINAHLQRLRESAEAAFAEKVRLQLLQS